MDAKADPGGEGPALAFSIAGAFAALALLPAQGLMDLKSCAALLLFALCAAGLAVRALSPGPAALVPPPPRGLLWLLGLVAAACTASWAASPYRALTQGVDDAALAGAGLVLAMSVAPEAWIRILLHAWRWSVLALALYAVAQHLGLDPVQSAVQAGSRSRSMASFGNADYFAAFLCLSWPLFLAWSDWRRNLALVAMLSALASTGSRAALVAVGVQALLAINLVWLGPKAAPAPPSGIVGQALRAYGSGRAKKRRPYLLPTIVAFFVFLSVWDWQRPTLRLAIWDAALGLWRQRPWLGWGPGAFVPAFQEHAAAGLEASLKATNQYVEDPHQLLLAVACAGGALGLLALGAAVHYGVRRVLASRREDAAALGLAAAGLLVQSQADRFFFQAGVFVPFCLLFGILARPEAAEGAPAAGLRTSRLARACVSAALACLALLALQRCVRPIQIERQAAAASMDAGLPALAGFDRAGQGAPPALSDSAASDPLAWERQGDALATQRRFPEAAQAFEQAMALQPSLGRAQNLGNCRLMDGDLRGAVAAFRQAVALDPANADAHFSLAYGLFYQRQLTESLAELDRCLRLDPANASALALRRQILP
jgi:O-antigen ligase